MRGDGGILRLVAGGANWRKFKQDFHNIPSYWLAQGQNRRMLMRRFVDKAQQFCHTS